MEEKKIRVDKKKNLVKVRNSRLKEPLKTVREVAEETGLEFSTVAKLDKELPQISTKDEKILQVCEKDFEIVKLGQEIIAKRLKDEEEVKKMRTFEIAQTIEKSEKRYMLFKGEATDKQGGLKDTSALESLNNLIGGD